MDMLIVDGYNIINAWKDIFDLENDSLENCRIKLQDLLSNYQGHTHQKIVVVYDAYMVVNNKGSLYTHDNLKIVYTKENQTADNFIERYVMLNSRYGNIFVATGDFLEQKTVFLKGGFRITARELRANIIGMKKIEIKHGKSKVGYNKFEEFLSEEQKITFEKLRRSNFDD